jgi:hypothetical protein
MNESCSPSNVLTLERRTNRNQPQRRLAVEEKAIRARRTLAAGGTGGRKKGSGTESGSESGSGTSGYEGGGESKRPGGEESDTSDEDAAVRIGPGPDWGRVGHGGRRRSGSGGEGRREAREAAAMHPSPLSHGVPPMGQVLNGATEGIPDITIRILLLGDSGVGKTSLMMRYSDDR